MINKFEWMVAKRYLASRGKDSFISVTAILSAVAIALGVCAIIAVMSVMNGFRAELMDKILGYHGHVLVQGYDGYLDDYENILVDMDGVKGIKRQTPFVEQASMIMFNGQAVGGVVRGLPERDFNDGKLPIARVTSGSVEATVSSGGVVLGFELAKRLRVKVGEYVTIVSPKPVNTPFGSDLREVAYPVSAIVEIGVYQFDETFVGIPLAESQFLFSMGESVTTIEMFLDKPEDVLQVAANIKEIVGKRGHVTHWKLFNNSLVGALEVERVAMFLILSLIVLVAVFNIGSSLFMLVKDKSGDIAILRTMGSERRSITRVFMIVGVVVGSIGTLVGTLLGLLIVHYIDPIKTAIEWLLGSDNLWDPSVRFVTNLTAVVDPTELILTVSIALLLSFLATIPPARRAAKLDPVEVLRHE